MGYTDISGRKVRFFKALKQRREREIDIIKVASTGIEMEDILVLDKKALLDYISNSGVFHTVRRRKK
jgi:hypothetical protein